MNSHQSSQTHPRGLYTLFFTEMWERFTFYGLRALLVLFLVDAVSTGGYGFHTRLADMISNRKAGREFMTLEADETPLPPVVFSEAPGNYVAALADNGKLLLVQLAELKYQAKGRGLILMGLDKGEKGRTGSDPATNNDLF